MSDSSVNTLILGAGPAGMASAMELVRAGKSVTVVEKADQVGGLAKTLTYIEEDGAFRTDIGPHRFFSKNQYLYEFIEDLLKEEWRQVRRLTRFCVDGKFYLYPIRIRNVLSQIGMVKAFRMIFDYAWEKIRGLVAPRPQRSFEDYVLSAFGRTLAEFNMIGYTEKIWGLRCSEISINWATQRIKGLSVVSALKKALFPKQSGPKTLIDSFYYPSFGSGCIYEAIRERIEKAGNPVLLNTEPSAIHWEGKPASAPAPSARLGTGSATAGRRVTDVDIRSSTGTKTLTPGSVISSVPPSVLVKLFNPAPPVEILDAASKLKFRSQVYLFLIIDKNSVMQDNWIYFPDKNIPFGRISEMKNFSTEMAPPGKSSLMIEFFCFEGDRIWNMDKNALVNEAVPILERFGFFTRSQVLNAHHFRIAHVYPLYDLHYEEHARTVMKWLDGFENFYAVGRPGRFRYTNQDHSLEMGILAAQSILTGVRKDIETVGAEQEYFERGYHGAQGQRG
ncbi:MAG: NAD(P)-binding protein [Candidatus Peribacteraceae bacterium]|nr:NAD(P)-binding protein [Candidatus Peribacteraceae bacterium]